MKTHVTLKFIRDDEKLTFPEILKQAWANYFKHQKVFEKYLVFSPSPASKPNKYFGLFCFYHKQITFSWFDLKNQNTY